MTALIGSTAVVAVQMIVKRSIKLSFTMKFSMVMSSFEFSFSLYVVLLGSININ